MVIQTSWWDAALGVWRMVEGLLMDKWMAVKLLLILRGMFG